MASLTAKLIGVAAATALLLAEGAQAKPTRQSKKVSPSLQKRFDEADSYGRVSLSHNDPQVQLTSYVFDYNWPFNFTGLAMQNYAFGVEFDAVTDLFASFAAPTYWLNRVGQDWMIFNPSVFIEASGLISMTLNLWVVELTFTMKFMGYKVTPFELQFAWDLDKKSRTCHSIGFFQEVFDLTFEVEQNTNECYVGLLGMFVP